MHVFSFNLLARVVARYDVMKAYWLSHENAETHTMFKFAPLWCPVWCPFRPPMLAEIMHQQHAGNSARQHTTLNMLVRPPATLVYRYRNAPGITGELHALRAVL